MYYLYDHLRKGSFRLAYCDTDSICIGLSRTLPIKENRTIEEYHRAVFDPLVRPEMKTSWEKTWRDRFVLSEKIEDKRRPGLLKRMLIFFSTSLFVKPYLK